MRRRLHGHPLARQRGALRPSRGHPHNPPARDRGTAKAVERTTAASFSTRSPKNRKRKKERKKERVIARQQEEAARKSNLRDGAARKRCEIGEEGSETAADIKTTGSSFQVEDSSSRSGEPRWRERESRAKARRGRNRPDEGAENQQGSIAEAWIPAFRIGPPGRDKTDECFAERERERVGK